MGRAKFYGTVRHTLFAGKLTQRQVEGMNIILDAFEVAKPKARGSAADAVWSSGRRGRATASGMERLGRMLAGAFPKK